MGSGPPGPWGGPSLSPRNSVPHSPHTNMTSRAATSSGPAGSGSSRVRSRATPRSIQTPTARMAPAINTATSTRPTSTARYASTVAHDVDALFALPPEEFTAARDELAKSLEERQAAKEVKALRRPTTTAWEAAAAEEAAAEAVAAGRLSRELPPPAGFEGLGGFEVLEGEGVDEAAEEERPDPAAVRAARLAEKWRTRLATAREELRAAERAADEATRRAADLERDLARARREAEDADAKRDRIARKVQEAERKLEEVSEP